MSLLLHIDTAVQTASVCLSEEERIVGIEVNPSQKDQAAWLQPAIKELLKVHGYSFQDLEAIAVSEGPGSYTGLRVGMATAKGLCYALKKPLITVNTLQMMAVAALAEPTEWLCPMIDARRMEVFSAIYDKELNTVVAPHNIVLEENSYKEQLEEHSITFFGNGSAKFKALLRHPNAHFNELTITAEHMVPLSYKRFAQKQFSDLAYTEPFYGKEFYSPAFKAR